MLKLLSNIPGGGKVKSIVQYATVLSDYYIAHSTKVHRKKYGQFFTPDTIACFMANLSERHPKRVLDPGSGLGILSCAIIEKIYRKDKDKQLHIDLYEKDVAIVKLLEKCMSFAKKTYPNFTYTIYPIDFVQTILSKRNNLFEQSIPKYELIIANPPYFKIPSTSPVVKSAKINGVHGHTNIYSLVMALSKELLEQNGELIFIVPRSFCNGLYFKYFRRQLLNELSLDYIHLFDSRRDAFCKDSVLQENVIIKMSNKPQSRNVKISSSKGSNDLQDIRPKIMDIARVVNNKCGHSIISIPISSEDEEIIKTIQKWSNTLRRLEMEISTGPIVSFRSKEHLSNRPSDYPLVQLNNVKVMNLSWPIDNFSKPQYVRNCKNISKWLIPNSNYVLVRRFSAKEDKQRLVAAPLIKDNIHSRFIGIENHVNFIHRPHGVLTINEIFGLAALLNSKLLNRYFEIINGHTQVNATDLRLMPLPDKNIIIKIGQEIREAGDWELAVSHVMEKLDSDIKRFAYV